MKILYLGNFNNKNSDKTEEHIKYAFERLGHEVIPFHENSLKKFEDLKKLTSIKADMFLYHKAGFGKNINRDDLLWIIFHMMPKKVMWYLDKIYGEREGIVSELIDYTDHVFVTDDTWRRRHKYNNVHCLRQGIGNEDMSLGKKRKEYECDIAFTGSIYGERENWAMGLKKIYGDKIKFFHNVFNRDLNDLCASAKIIIAPEYPLDEFYWSSRFYLTLGSGGFLVHPDLYGLKDEFQEGKHFVGYKGFKEMIITINYFLENEEQRKAIQKEGRKQCLKVATYKDRIEQMLNTIYGSTKTLQGNKRKDKTK